MTTPKRKEIVKDQSVEANLVMITENMILSVSQKYHIQSQRIKAWQEKFLPEKQLKNI